MQYRANPKNGDKLSILGFGCMRFGGTDITKSFVGKPNAQKAEEGSANAENHKIC